MNEEDWRHSTISLLGELLAWNKLAAREHLAQALGRALRDEKHLKAYELSDGSRSQDAIASGTGLSQPTISRLWAQWLRLGIGREVEGRFVHLMAPSDLNLSSTNYTRADPQPRRQDS